MGETVQRSGEIAERLGVKVQSIAPVRNGLIKKGMIYSPAHGDTAFGAEDVAAWPHQLKNSGLRCRRPDFQRCSSQRYSSRR
jgi:hypothetical protein